MLRVLMHPQLKTAKYRLNMNMSLPCLACPLLNQKNCFVPCVEVPTLPRDIVGTCGYVRVLTNSADECESVICVVGVDPSALCSSSYSITHHFTV